MSRGVTSAVNTIFESNSVSPFVAIDLDFDGGNFVDWTGYGNLHFGGPRLEVRPVGQECRSRWSPYHLQQHYPPTTSTSNIYY